MTINSLASKFLKVFDGYDLAYGQHCDLIKSDSGKVKGKAQTISNKLPIQVVEKHLDGTGNSLGIVPLKSNNKVKFGVIDIDGKHPTNPRIHSIEEIEEKVNKLQLPLIPCQSKSGDIHLYCFTKEEIPAILLIDRLKEWSSLLGYGNVEIFPKQNHRIDEKDIGNWINLPYFDHEKTQRFAINKKKKLNIEEFFEYVEIMRVGLDEMEDFKYENVDESFNDAPPCLQTIVSSGEVLDGGRYNSLFSFAVYFKKKYPDNYEEKILKLNTEILNPPADLRVLENIIKGVNKKEYFYQCEQPPICQFCNKDECFNRKFGIGGNYGGELEFNNLTKYISSDASVRWYADYRGQRIKLTTDELLNQRLLAKKMLDATNSIFTPMKNAKWMGILDGLLKNCTVYDDPIDASPMGQFKELVDTFLTEGVSGTTKSDLLKYNTYLSDKENRIYFKSANLFSYLKNKRFNYDEQEAWHWLKDYMGGQSKQMNIGGKNIRAWSLPAPEFYKEDDLI